ncbi:hypothetical protein M9458_047076, partial [Cirrhinus mrigala]
SSSILVSPRAVMLPREASPSALPCRPALAWLLESQVPPRPSKLPVPPLSVDQFWTINLPAPLGSVFPSTPPWSVIISPFPWNSGISAVLHLFISMALSIFTVVLTCSVITIVFQHPSSSSAVMLPGEASPSALPCRPALAWLLESQFHLVPQRRQFHLAPLLHLDHRSASITSVGWTQVSTMAPPLLGFICCLSFTSPSSTFRGTSSVISRIIAFPEGALCHNYVLF